MSDEPRTPTAQEQAIYDALQDGDHDEIEQLRQDAYSADQGPPDPLPDGWLSPADQFDSDYLHAWTQYQDDHEAPDAAREDATAAEVEAENDALR